MGDVHFLDDVIRSQNQGEARGIVSICSANPFVIEASFQHASKLDSPVLIESTCNQVNQYGGYTGMTPGQFVAYIGEIAEKLDFPPERILLGGDHLGPYPWRAESVQVAMQKSQELVRDYMQAGYIKIHLDASTKCAGDDPKHPLQKSVAAQRAATLARVAEQTYLQMGGGRPAPRYIIGTEVPEPGGALAIGEQLIITTVQDIRETIEVTRDAFIQQGLKPAWERVIAVVVQPGVEFGDASVHSYDREQATELSRFIEDYPGLVYEAHSTDYQTRTALQEMVEDHFAILKVGPALTFAFREAIFALAWMERELLGNNTQVELSHIIEVLDEVMVENPKYWAPYYSGGEHEIQFARKYSLSDRSRYYWPNPKVQDALKRLLRNLQKHEMPLSLLSQALPAQYHAVRAGKMENKPLAWIIGKIESVLSDYYHACGML